MRIKARIDYAGFSLTSVDAKTLKMRGSKMLDLPDVSVMEWAQDRDKVEEKIKRLFEGVVKPKTMKFGNISRGQYDIGTMVGISAELIENKEVAQKALDIEEDHIGRLKKLKDLEKKIEEIEKNAQKEVKELKKLPEYDYNIYSVYRLDR